MIQNSRSWYYNITSPDGQFFEGIKNLREFCAKNNLYYKGVKKTSYYGKSYKFYGGWKFEKISEKNETQNVDLKNEKLKSYGLTAEERIIKLIDENNYLKGALRNSQRESGLFKELAGVIRETVVSADVKPYILKRKKSKIRESAVLVLSDLHADSIVRPEQVDNLECYNFNVFCRRAERLVDTVISHLTENMTNYEFDTLYIMSCGDLVSGLIHGHEQYSSFGNIIKNSMATGEVISMMIRDLSQYFKHIVYTAVSGNHGRMSIKKDFIGGAHKNFDYLTNVYAMTRLEDLVKSGRLEYNIPDSFSCMVEIKGFNYIINHGDSLKGFAGIPFYGLNRRSNKMTSLGAITGRVPHVFIYGHYHTPLSETSGHTETLMSGSFVGTDPFAYDKLGAFNYPSQLIFGVHESFNITWKLNIHLRPAKNWMEEESKQGRYKINLF